MVAIDDATKDQQDAVTRYLKSENVGFWHYFSDLWLVTEGGREWTAADLRSNLLEVVPGATLLVMPIESGRKWAAYGPKGTFKWLRETWTED